MSKPHREWRATFEPSRPSTGRPNTVRLVPVVETGQPGADHEFADVGSAVAAMVEQLKRGALPIEFAASIAAGRSDQRAGLMMGMDISRGPVASIAWGQAVVNSLIAWHIRNERPELIVKMADDWVSLTLAPPCKPTP